MKNFSLLFIAFLLLQVNTPAQQGWFWQNPLPQGNHLFSVKFISPTVGWAVGDVGTIVRTTNGGADWTVQISSIIDDRLNGVSFTDSDNGTAVGWYGKS